MEEKLDILTILYDKKSKSTVFIVMIDNNKYMLDDFLYWRNIEDIKENFVWGSEADILYGSK